MKIGVYIKYGRHFSDPRTESLLQRLREARMEIYPVAERGDVQEDTDMVLSIGGDGTFLSASKRVADSGIPIMGVNLGRLGFLSENPPEKALEALLGGEYTIESRSLLQVGVEGPGAEGKEDFWPFALNEVTLHRKGAAVMGIRASVDGMDLPTYWADGLIVATSSGSTAYSLSAGGPICMPEAPVLLVVPIAPHNLNVRPLVVPDSSVIRISPVVRERTGAILTMDNRTREIDASDAVRLSLAPFPLRRVRAGNSNFVKALTGKLFWGEDIRNNGR